MVKSKHPSRKKRILKIVLIVVGILIVIRLILPYVILHFANKTLANMDGYRGKIKDIDLAIIRGAYNIDSIYLNKVDSVTGKETPFFAAQEIDLSIEWRALFHGSIVGELEVEAPMLRFTKDKVEPEDIRKDSTDFKQVFEGFMPLEVNRFEIRNGVIKYIDEFSKPPVNIEMTEMYVLAQNLKNSYDSASSSSLPASIYMRSHIYEGTLECNVKLNPLADEPTFDINAELHNTNLVKLNEFFQAYAKADVSKGTFGLYTEVAAKEGQFNGYVKPMLKDVKIVGHEDRDDNVLQKLWEGFIGTVGQVFENVPKDQVATKIPFKGDIKDPNTNIWLAIANILRNAFIQALQPSIDNEINIATVDNPKEEKKTFLEKVFGGKDKKDDKDKKEEKEK